MAVVLGVPGRFGELSLHRSDIKSVREPHDPASIGSRVERIWDRIKDWFCGSRLIEAKEHLAVLYAPDATSLKKAESYFRLKELVGAGYSDRFSEKTEAFGFSVNINFGEGLEAYSHSIAVCNHEYLSQEINQDIAKADKDSGLHERYVRELVRDLPRAGFSVAHEPIAELLGGKEAEQGNLEKFRAAISEKLSCTAEQKLAIEVMTYQKLQGMVRQSAWDQSGGLFGEEIAYISGNGRSMYDISQKGDDIEIWARSPMSWLELPADAVDGIPPRSCLFRDPVLDVKILIAPDGKATVISALFGSDPEAAGSVPDTNPG